MNTAARVGGLAAVAGGILRIGNAFAGQLPQATLAVSYFVTDVLLLAGVAGLWLTRRAQMGWAGSAGLAIFVLGILAVRASAFGIGSYPLGAGVALIGLAVHSVDALVRRASPWAPVFWLSAVPPAVTAVLGVAPFAMSALAAVAFGAGFMLAGIVLLRDSRGGA